LHYLFAEGASPIFRQLAVETVGTQMIPLGKIRLATICQGKGLAKVVWQHVRLQADGLRPSAELQATLQAGQQAEAD
jgi:hypothetical protein